MWRSRRTTQRRRYRRRAVGLLVPKFRGLKFSGSINGAESGL
jgi:hypothetical protein